MTSVHAGIAHQPRDRRAIEYLQLVEVTVKAWVVDVSSRIVLIQTFYNPSNEPTGRAKYVFPLPASAAVCAFKLESEDGSVIVAEAKEKEEAASMFTRAVERGKTTALVESVTDDIFTISIGTVPATTRMTAYLTFVMNLLDEGLQDRVRLQLPIHIAERYGTQPAAMHDASAADSRTQLRINVDIQTSGIIHEIKSPTHSIVRRRYKGHSGQGSQRRMSAIWKSSEFLASDFVITIHAEGLDKPRCFAEVLGAGWYGGRKGSTIAMQLTLVSKFLAPKLSSQEYIFVIDRSGSMSNKPIETAKQTLSILLRLLPNLQTTFNILSFGSEVTCLWKRSHRLDHASLVEATKHVKTMSANYGGTEIPKALQSAFNLRMLDRPAAVFLLTDGLVDAAGESAALTVISDAVQNSPLQAPARLFVLGIGSQVSSDICSRLARRGNGEYLFALTAEDITGKCARLLNAGRSKNIERISVDWGYSASSYSSPITPNRAASFPELAPPPLVQQAPHSLTNIFSGIRFTVFSVASSGTVLSSVKLTTKLEGEFEPRELTVPVTKVKPFRDTDQDSAIPIVHTLAARKLIMDLDDGVGLLPSAVPGDALLVSEDDLKKAGIVRLGLTYQLASKYTSFVAVEVDGARTRLRRRRSGNAGWIRSRLRQTELDIHQESPAEAPTFLDSLINVVSSFISSTFGFHSGPVASTSTTKGSSHSRSQHRPVFPGAYDGSDSSTGGSDRGRRRRRSCSPAQSSASHHSTDTFSTLSSFEESSCSACWTPSRSPSPLPPFRDPDERAPSPEFRQVPGVSNGTVHPGSSNKQDTIPREVYDLLLQMDFDGLFTASPLLTQLVGDAVLNKADGLRINRNIWATVVVAAYMKKHLEGEPDLLELLLEKARESVEAQDKKKRDGARSFDEMVREAVALLGP